MGTAGPVQPPPPPALCSRRGGDRRRQGRKRQGGCRRGLGEPVTLSSGSASVRAGVGQWGKLALWRETGRRPRVGPLAPCPLSHLMSLGPQSQASPGGRGAAPPGLLPRPACPPLPTGFTPLPTGFYTQASPQQAEGSPDVSTCWALGARNECGQRWPAWPIGQPGKEQ